MVTFIEIGLTVIAMILMLLGAILIYLEYKDEERNQNVLVAVVAVIGIAAFLLVVNSVVLVLNRDAVEVAKVDQEELNTLKSKNIVLTNQLKRALTLKDINDIFGGHFPGVTLTNENLQMELHTVFKGAKEYQYQQEDWRYNLFLLESRLATISRGLIDTRVAQEESVDFTADMLHLQKILKFLGYFKGEPDGDQASASEALKAYQMAVNKQKGGNWIKSAYYGLFGKGTIAQLKLDCTAKK
ncbi:MAG: hypothetical protein OCC49_15265 [Fibrobacterales bacterium]